MAPSSPYFKTEANTPTDKPERNRVVGDGVVTLHGSSLDVDRSVRISDLLSLIAAQAERISVLEAYLGANGATQKPLAGIILGVWKYVADGNDIVKYVDLNAGVGSPDWQERGRDTL